MNKPWDGKKTGLEPIAKRVPIERKIDLRFPNFEGLVTGVSSNLSTSGIFIQSDHPEPAGTEFAFALRIEEWSPIQGEAKVIWTRSKSEGPERPAGMGVQFVEVDAQSRRMIRWLVDKNLQEGGTPFDVEKVPAGASKYGGPAESQKASGKRSRKGKSAIGAGRPGSKNKILLWLLIAAVLLAGAYGAYVKWIQDQPGSGTLQSPEPGVTAESIPIDGGSAVEGLSTEPVHADVSAIAEVTHDEIAGFIQSWASAWEALDAPGLIDHYADDFEAQPHGGRQQWEADIRNQIEGSGHIRVAVSALEISYPTADSARASFYRSFRSDSVSTSGRVVLDLEPEAGGWKIRAESSVD